MLPRMLRCMIVTIGKKVRMRLLRRESSVSLTNGPL